MQTSKTERGTAQLGRFINKHTPPTHSKTTLQNSYNALQDKRRKKDKYREARKR